MAWGDSWGLSPCKNARRAAKAFFEGRDIGSSRDSCYVRFGPGPWMQYYYKGYVIARYTPPVMMTEELKAKLVADALKGEGVKAFPELVFCPIVLDKGEARHLQALGVDAQWQWGGKPFLCFGANIEGKGWLTIEQCKHLPKWVEPPKPVRPRREPFVNLTMPLPGFA